MTNSAKEKSPSSPLKLKPGRPRKNVDKDKPKDLPKDKDKDKDKGGDDSAE